MFPLDGFAGPVNSCNFGETGALTDAWCSLGLSSRLGWAGEITAIGLGTVILMLLVLMVFLMIITAIFPPKPEEDEEEDDEPAAAAAPVAAASGTSDVDLAALAVAITTALGQGGPALVANKSGSGLADSRWVSIGRSTTNLTWQRS
ncbi:MAG: OadG family protein [Propionibacteriaceae bacterium]|jgi:sodium pump decarboxylase gamma subunit|nr:OadG family protein [Propionibacteriaceae bacterium]